MTDKIEESNKHYEIELPIEDFNKLKELSKKLDVSIEDLIRYIIIENVSNRSIQ